MERIDQDLLAAISKATKLSQGQVYARIKQVADTEYLPRHLAAIKVGADSGVTINKYATPEDLSQLRQAGSPVAPPDAKAAAEASIGAPRAKAGSKPPRK